MAQTKKLTNIPLVDFRTEYKSIKRNINIAVKRVLESGWFILGPELGSFEKEFAKYLGVKHVVGVSSGTDALTIAIKSLGLTAKDGVIVPANVYPTAFGVSLSGATLQLADVGQKSLNITVKNLKKAIQKNTKAVVVVHLYGNPVDIEPIVKFCKKHKLYLIEDCAQSAGAIYKGNKTGTFGDVSCFSFYPTKNLGAYGDAGAIATNNDNIYEKIKLLRMYGEKERYQSVLVGHNSRLDELQAAILREKLNYLDKWNAARNKIANIYKKGLAGLPIQSVEVLNCAQSSYHLFVIKIKNREELINYLAKNGVKTGVHYPTPIHLTETFRSLGYKPKDFPIAESACEEVLSLPIYPQLKGPDVNHIVSLVNNYFKNHQRD